MSDLMLLSDIEAEQVNGGGLPVFFFPPKPSLTVGNITGSNVALQRAKVEQNNIALGLGWITNQYNGSGVTQSAG